MRFSPRMVTLFTLLLVVVIAPLFFSSSYHFRVGSLVLMNTIAVMGIMILTGFVGQISLGHAGFIGIGAYSCALAPKLIGLPVFMSAILGAVISAVIAWIVGRPILRLRGYYLSVATLGFGILISMVLTNESWLTGGPDGMEVPNFALRAWLGSIGIKLSNAQFWYAFSSIIMLIGAAVALNLQYSATGRALRALHDSEVAAATIGVDVARYKLKGFVISAVYASFAGSLLAMQNRYVTPDLSSFMHSIEIVTMAVLGGAASVVGAFFGATILTALPQVLTFLQEYEQIALGLIMMLVMIFLPNGVLPSLLRLLRGRH